MIRGEQDMPVSHKKHMDSPLHIEQEGCALSVILNRPEALNSLTLEMVRLVAGGLKKARRDDRIRLVVFSGAGQRGFCAGGDIKFMARAVKGGVPEEVLLFLEEEYRVDLSIHRFPKPVVVLADGITMGGGLGLAAGADLVVATERTRTAMPETRIGFFPDVGATGWMFTKCPPGYPEYLGLTGYEMIGAECVRVGFATHLIGSEHVTEILALLKERAGSLAPEKTLATKEISRLLDPWMEKDIPIKPDMDDWVRTYFAGKTSIVGMVEDLRQCSIQSRLCDGVFHRLSERSPTALAVTLELLRHNEGRPMEEVFEADLKAARFLLSHPDYIEGVRARLIAKDDQPRWQPDRIETVGHIDLRL
jgi:enoyl-CoA hydratase